MADLFKRFNSVKKKSITFQFFENTFAIKHRIPIFGEEFQKCKKGCIGIKTQLHAIKNGKYGCKIEIQIYK